MRQIKNLTAKQQLKIALTANNELKIALTAKQQLKETTMKALYWAAGIFIFMSYTWTMYLAVMALKRVKDETPEKITTAVKIFGYPLLFVGLIFDVVFNVVLGTILFLELPELDRLLFTSRLDKHATQGSGYKKKLAQWFCHEFLNSFDPSGCHCGECEDED